MTVSMTYSGSNAEFSESENSVFVFGHLESDDRPSSDG